MRETSTRAPEIFVPASDALEGGAGAAATEAEGARGAAAARAEAAGLEPTAGPGETGAGLAEGGPGAVAFLSKRRLRERARLLEQRGLLVPVLPPATPGDRGRLAERIEHAWEAALIARGAAPPGVGAGSVARAVLADQLLRARAVGVSGLAVVMGSLRAACGEHGALDPDDSACLRTLASLGTRLPVHLLLEGGDATLAGYGAPVALPALLQASAEGGPADDDSSLAATGESAAPETPAPGPRSSREERLRACVEVLERAHGPQSLAAFERIFMEAYVPVGMALARGEGPPGATHAYDAVRSAFARVYQEAFPRFAVGRKPRLVLDAPETAARAARLHGARGAHLLLVAGLRFDLGLLVKRALVTALEGRASLTEELLLWSSLPSRSGPQLDGLARGLDALRHPDATRADDALRGRPAEIVRRLRVGSRDLFKLDLVEAKLLEAGPAAAAALPAIAAQVAAVIARHAEHVPPRTLLLVFGDHGFTLDATGAARHGGASPEEVLVPAFAFLLGDVH